MQSQQLAAAQLALQHTSNAASDAQMQVAERSNANEQLQQELQQVRANLANLQQRQPAIQQQIADGTRALQLVPVLSMQVSALQQAVQAARATATKLQKQLDGSNSECTQYVQHIADLGMQLESAHSELKSERALSTSQ